MNAVKDWWSQASSRDQMMVLVGGVFICIYILFMAVLGPIKEMKETEVKKTMAQRASLERVKELAAKVIAQNSTQSGQQQSSIETIVQRSLGPSGIQISSMNANGKTGVRLRFDEVPFDKILKWLHEMEVGQGLIIKDLAISPANNPGMVSANLRMEQE